MSKLAVYESGIGASDLQNSRYFKQDYVYKQNMWTRFFVLIGSLIICALRIMHITAVSGNDFFTMFASGSYVSELTGMIFFIVALQIVYTAIGMKIHRAAYDKSQKRLDRYFAIIEELDKRNERKSV